MKMPPLVDGRMIRRYQRFLADVELPDGRQVTAHCPNTGAMTGCWEPGAPVQLSASDNPRRKLRWTLERVDMGAGWIGVNTSRVNTIVRSFIEQGAIAPLAGLTVVRAEPVYPAGDGARRRFDLLLESPDGAPCYVEIKNATLAARDAILFPDAVTARGTRHLELLRHAAGQGCRAVLLFAVSRPEGRRFGIAAHIDPAYHEALVRAHRDGVEVLPVRVRHRGNRVEAGEILPWSPAQS